MAKNTLISLLAAGLLSTCSAASQLQKTLLALNGADDYVFHIGREASAGLPGADFDKLHPFGYYVAKQGRDLYLAGRNDRATEYAVADFLRRYAGYRDFGSPLFTVQPHVDRLRVDGEDFIRREEPSVASYNLAGAGSSRNFGRDRRCICTATHALCHLLDGQSFAEHPEYYPMRGDKRLDPKGGRMSWQPCMSNPDLPKLFAAYAERFFAENPEAIGIPVGVNDGNGACTCPGCEELFAKHRNQYVEFYNLAARLLAKSHPGKYLAFIA